MEKEYLELGATFIIAMGLLRIIELLITKYVFNRKTNGEYSKELLMELQKTNENHLDHLRGDINNGFDRITDTINGNDKQVIQLLGEIKGKLSK